MKRLTFLLGVAFLTFSVGFILAFNQPRIFQPSPAISNVSEHIRLNLQRLEKLENSYEMRFQVLNDSSEVLRYQRYSKDDHCAFLIKRSGGADTQVPCFCGTGLAERTLNPGETAVFSINLGQGYGQIRVGFDFLVGKARRKEAVWSEEISLP
jgi:hypothetical protein